MNAHDNDEGRTFAALPPARGGAFARTWWGRAWLTALEDGALDAEQVRTGRRLARAGAVGAVSVRPGRVTAVVRDTDLAQHRADVLLDRLSDAQWDRLLGLAVERAGHVAALLDREMPPDLVEDAGTVGIDLLPGLGELEAECGCGAWDHCRHTAAVCYQVARLLDQDPFVLLLLRGRTERRLMDDLQERGTTPPGTDVPVGPDSVDGEEAAGSASHEGVDAAEAYAAGDMVPPLPAAPDLPPEPGVPPSLDTDAPPPPGVEPAALGTLAALTAVAARALLAEALHDGAAGRAPTARPTVAQDAVRLAAGVREGAGGVGPSADALTERLARGSGRDRDQLTAAVLAWRHGGAEALSVCEEEWPVEGETLARARAALGSAWEEDERPLLRARANRWTVVGTACQLRLGRDGRWWPYREEGGRWWPAGEAGQDPASVLVAAMARPDGEEALSQGSARSDGARDAGPTGG
ncbi:SWF or SNF family helicase [Streptomyces asoensis]|uniref:SWIM zinc finger family protein n=1 Tax=Streptomyces asoensis TaxID=249586 RepID=UPI0033CEFBB9